MTYPPPEYATYLFQPHKTRFWCVCRQRCPPSKLNTKVPDRLGARLAGACVDACVGPALSLGGPGARRPWALLALLLFSCLSATFRADFFTTLHWIAIFLTRNKLKIRACSS
ncbi:unnamed protein product [Rangifer tarandus platyrhynchus]|uniref:Uncharacterized protein n=2 Tax=Rangifer tarandus platyrhynchus TaxID=3082113 RepID=A0ABN8YKY1_RANTA|nr:unnamed protein product [Rangifer tarandus platyrhynchus]